MDESQRFDLNGHRWIENPDPKMIQISVNGQNMKVRQYWSNLWNFACGSLPGYTHIVPKALGRIDMVERMQEVLKEWKGKL